MNEQNDDRVWFAVWCKALVVMSLGWDLAIPIFGGILLGYYLDRWLMTGHVFTVGLLALGTVVSFYNLLRFVRRINRNRERELVWQKKGQENES